MNVLKMEFFFFIQLCRGTRLCCCIGVGDEGKRSSFRKNVVN